MVIKTIKERNIMKQANETADMHDRDKRVQTIKIHLKDAMNQALSLYGTGNMYAAGMAMYETLFGGAEVDGGRNGYYTDEPLMSPQRVVPDRDEFVTWFREALVHDAEFQKACEYPGAIEAVDAMIAAGPTVIWTEGDTLNAVGDAPGSGEQLEKIRGTGVFDRGIDRAMANIATRTGNAEGGAPGEALLTGLVDGMITAEASESKFSEASVARVVDHLRRQNVHKVVVLEDRLSNAIRMSQILESEGFDAYPVWVKQGRHGRKEGNRDGAVLEATNIAEAGDTVTALRARAGEPIGIVCDFDGVLGDQEKREQLQAERIYDEAMRQGW